MAGHDHPLDALSLYIRRYAELARQMASSETRLRRQNELMEVAEVCEWIAMEPARTLREALQNPEEHRDLVVRVAGFTAYFVTLTPAIQQEIIARTEAEI